MFSLVSLGVSPSFINPFISILDDALNASDAVVVLAITSISSPNEE